MESSHNPYLPPTVDLGQDYADEEGSYWRDGKRLILRRDAQMPPRCVKCNDDAARPLRDKKLYWHYPGWYVLLLIHPFVYLIGALIVRKRAKVAYGLCGRHLRRFRLGSAAGWLSLIVAIAAIFTMIADDGDHLPAAIVSCVSFLSAIVCAMVFGRTIHARRIDENEIQIGGCSKPFLDSAPERARY